MSEYVCGIDDDYEGVPWESDDYSGTCERREEVVRCRDCVHAYRRSSGVYCSRFLQRGSNDRQVPLPVDTDCFCAWGVRRESE